MTDEEIGRTLARDAARRRQQRRRERKRSGGCVLNIPVDDFEGLIGFLRSLGFEVPADPARVAAVTTEWIRHSCGEWRRQQGLALFERPSPVIGLLARETEPP